MVVFGGSSSPLSVAKDEKATLQTLLSLISSPCIMLALKLSHYISMALILLCSGRGYRADHPGKGKKARAEDGNKARKTCERLGSSLEQTWRCVL